jgi:hypothetical protein
VVFWLDLQAVKFLNIWHPQRVQQDFLTMAKMLEWKRSEPNPTNLLLHYSEGWPRSLPVAWLEREVSLSNPLRLR